MSTRDFSGMHKPVFVMAGLAIVGLLNLSVPNRLAWGRESADSLRQRGPQGLLQVANNYQPPGSSNGPRRTTGGGTRGGGCEDTAAIDITALASQIHIGQTVSTQPTLTWFVADETSYPVELQLYRYKSNDPTDSSLEPIDTYDIGPSQPGYMTFTLPDDQPALIVGETYRWKVILKCSPSQPSRNRIDEADLQVVVPPTGLATTNDPVQQAEQYAAAGLWYDAIAVLSQAPVSPAAATYRRELIANLAELEAENPNDRFSLFSDRLTYIADQE